MAEIVNLGDARKQRAKREKERKAAENRGRFGETKAMRHKREALEAERRRLLDGARLDEGRPGAAQAEGELPGGARAENPDA